MRLAVDPAPRKDRSAALFLGVLMLLGTALSAAVASKSPRESWRVQATGVAAAAAWIAGAAFLSRRSRSESDEAAPPPPATRVAGPGHSWVWIAGAAVAVRLVALSFIPPAEQTILEEVQTGAAAADILETGRLPIEFRFTKLFGSAGLLIASEPSLADLRRPFVVLGVFGLLAFVALLRSLGVRPPIALLASLTMGGLPWMVLAGGTADELVSGLSATTLLLLALVRVDAGSPHRVAWSGLAGLVSGALLFEYASYRLLPCAGGLWLLVRAARSTWRGERDAARTDRLAVLGFTACAFAVALPTLVDVAKAASGSVFFENLRRHATAARPLLGRQSLENTAAYAKTLLGFPVADAQKLGAQRAPMVWWPVGAIAVATASTALVRPLQPVLRAAALLIVVGLPAMGILANNFSPGRLTPLLAILLVLASAQLSLLADRVVPRGRGGRRLPTFGAALGVAAGLALAAVGIRDSVRLSRDPVVRDLWSSDDYPAVRAVAAWFPRGGPVVHYKKDPARDSTVLGGDNRWLLPRGLTVQVVDGLPTGLPETAGLVRVRQGNRPLTVKEVEELASFATRIGRGGDLRTAISLEHEVVAAGILARIPAKAGSALVALAVAPPGSLLAIAPHDVAYDFAPPRLGLGVSGGPLTVAGRRYLGISAHAWSRLSYRLPPGTLTFEAAGAIEDAVRTCKSATVRFVVTDADGKTLFRSEVVRAGDAPVPIRVDVEGRAEIRLVTEDAGDGHDCDHAVWLEPVLVTERSETRDAAGRIAVRPAPRSR